MGRKNTLSEVQSSLIDKPKSGIAIWVFFEKYDAAHTGQDFPDLRAIPEKENGSISLIPDAGRRQKTLCLWSAPAKTCGMQNRA
jgi:hypothetical protein